MKKTRIIASIVIIMLCVGLASIRVVNAKTYNFRRTYTFKGEIARINYKDSKNDFSWHILKLNKTIKVKYHGKKRKIRYLNIYSSRKVAEKIDKKYKKRVRIKGKLFKVKLYDITACCDFAVDATKLK